MIVRDGLRECTDVKKCDSDTATRNFARDFAIFRRGSDYVGVGKDRIVNVSSGLATLKRQAESRINE